MRAVRLPASVAVCVEPCTHFLVTAVDGSRSYDRFKAAQQQQQQQQQHRDAARPMRLDGLLPADWSSLLALCRALTHPQQSFNFSSPGDVGAAGGGAVVNGAFMHVVARAPGDFEPNNMIYHSLQQYTCDSSAASASTKVAEFQALLRRTQQQAPQSAVEAAELAAAALHAQRPPLSTAQKQALDPLAQDTTAAEKTAANMRINADCPSDVEVFTFYPYACSVAASIPYRSKHFCVMVNLKPIVPNHLMVVPLRCVGTIHALSEEEVEDWARTIALTVRVLNEVARRCQPPPSSTAGTPSIADSAGNYSVAIQQGVLAGQTVAHLHTHVIPFDPAGRLAGEPEKDEDEQRRRPPRTAATMRMETDYLRPIFRELAQQSS